MEQPIYYWDPVIAPGDMILYTGNLFPCKGDLIIAALGTTQLVRLDIEDDRVIGEERLMSDQGRIRHVTQTARSMCWSTMAGKCFESRGRADQRLREVARSQFWYLNVSLTAVGAPHRP